MLKTTQKNLLIFPKCSTGTSKLSDKLDESDEMAGKLDIPPLFFNSENLI